MFILAPREEDPLLCKAEGTISREEVRTGLARFWSLSLSARSARMDGRVEERRNPFLVNGFSRSFFFQSPLFLPTSLFRKASAHKRLSIRVWSWFFSDEEVKDESPVRIEIISLSLRLFCSFIRGPLRLFYIQPARLVCPAWEIVLHFSKRSRFAIRHALFLMIG